MVVGFLSPPRKDFVKVEIISTPVKGTRLRYDAAAERASRYVRAEMLEDAISLIQNELLSLYPNPDSYGREVAVRKTPKPGR